MMKEIWMLFTKKKIWIAFVISLLLFGFGSFNIGQVSAQDPDINIYLFYGEGCPHCAKAKPALQEIADADPRIGYHEFEVYFDEVNRELFIEFAAVYGFEPRVVPTIFIGEKIWEGYSDTIKTDIESYLQHCLSEGCPDYGREILIGENSLVTDTPQQLTPTLTPSLTPTSVVTPTPIAEVNEKATASLESSDSEGESFLDAERTITLPLLGSIDLSERSLLLSTLLISFVDGFNPCSIWVLSMLLAITLNTRSRKKVLIIGFVFIFVTGLIYALFIGGLFTIFSFINFLGWIRVIVAIVALIFALVNIKDYFWYKKGISFTIRDQDKPGIYQGIRRVLNSDESIWALIGATIVLAAGVSLVEFSCTAGFPLLWSNLLASREVTSLVFIGFLLVYMIVYQLDELGIFLVSVFTLRTTKLEEKHGRLLKLLGGSLMLCLALVMLIDPSIMNDILNSLWVFGVAFGLAGFVLLMHRVVLPKFNLYIGSED